MQLRGGRAYKVGIFAFVRTARKKWRPPSPPLALALVLALSAGTGTGGHGTEAVAPADGDWPSNDDEDEGAGTKTDALEIGATGNVNGGRVDEAAALAEAAADAAAALDGIVKANPGDAPTDEDDTDTAGGINSHGNVDENEFVVVAMEVEAESEEKAGAKANEPIGFVLCAPTEKTENGVPN